MLYWVIPSWIGSLVASFLLGFYLRGITKKLTELEKVVQSKVDKKPVPEEPISMLIDPDDAIQEALYQRKLLEKRLNPDE